MRCTSGNLSAASNPTLLGALAFAADVERLESELDNVRAALRWCIDRRRISLALPIACDAAMRLLAWHADSSSAGTAEDAVSPIQQALVAASAAPFIGNRGDALRARKLAEESVAVLEPIEPAAPACAQSLILLSVSQPGSGAIFGVPSTCKFAGAILQSARAHSRQPHWWIRACRLTRLDSGALLRLGPATR